MKYALVLYFERAPTCLIPRLNFRSTERKLQFLVTLFLKLCATNDLYEESFAFRNADTASLNKSKDLSPFSCMHIEKYILFQAFIENKLYKALFVIT